MPAFELVAAAPAGATGPTSARAAARTAPAIHVFMQSMSSCEPCLHGSAPRTISSATQGRPAALGLSQLTRTQAAGITSGASGDDDADDNPSGDGGANGGGASGDGGASALGW